MSDLAWLMGDPVASYEHAQEMLGSRAARAATSRPRPRSMFMAWCLVEGPWPAHEAIARCDELARVAAGLRRGRAHPARVPRRAHGDGRAVRRARGDMARARAGLARARPDLMAVYLGAARGDRRDASPAIPPRPSAPSATPRRWSRARATAGTTRWSASTSRTPSSPRAATRRRSCGDIDAAPAPCDLEWVVKRHTARAWVAARAGDHGRHRGGAGGGGDGRGLR